MAKQLKVGFLSVARKSGSLDTQLIADNLNQYLRDQQITEGNYIDLKIVSNGGGIDGITYSFLIIYT